ncbi:MAG: DUF1667 domain-containing protein [Lachnospiraceae bacterium]|jgi:CxxC motif-containing protein
MLSKRELTCIGCPMGCTVQVTMDDGKIIEVNGNTCPKGDVYARKEVTNPTRIVTSTVIVRGGDHERLSVKTAADVPKGKIFDVMRDINKVIVQAPVKIGDVVLENAGGTGVAVIATRNIAAV